MGQEVGSFHTGPRWRELDWNRKGDSSEQLTHQHIPPSGKQALGKWRRASPLQFLLPPGLKKVHRREGPYLHKPT